MISTKIKTLLRDVSDFPKPGIVFKDITPLLQNPDLCKEILDEFVIRLEGTKIDVIVGIESRGFLFGMMLAQKLGCAFVPVRKKGKLPFHTISQEYDLEYGTAILELHNDAILPGQNVLIHDDLLATGGTVEAAAKLVKQLNGNIVGFTFIISLDFLKGSARISPYSNKIITLAPC